MVATPHAAVTRQTSSSFPWLPFCVSRQQLLCLVSEGPGFEIAAQSNLMLYLERNDDIDP